MEIKTIERKEVEMEKEKMSQEIYATKDLYEGAYLLAKGQKLNGLKPERNYYFFTFRDKSACEKASLLYWSGTGSVNAKDMTNAIRTLKDLIFSKQ